MKGQPPPDPACKGCVALQSWGDVPCQFLCVLLFQNKPSPLSCEKQALLSPDVLASKCLSSHHHFVQFQILWDNNDCYFHSSKWKQHVHVQTGMFFSKDCFPGLV